VPEDDTDLLRQPAQLAHPVYMDASRLPRTMSVCRDR
jgi:hypothetical protein